MNVSIIGAGGVIGRQIVITLVQERIIPISARLQLVGHSEGKSKRLLYGLASDLVDAYAEIIPGIDVCLDPEKVHGDIIIFAAGKSSVNEPGKGYDRQALASANLPVFKSYAETLARNRKHGEEIVVIVTNPVELGVEIFSRHFERSHVIGMGAFSDTMRFRREIATELGCRRQNVQGLVLGEHGMGMVPCWSTVKVYGYISSKKQEEVAALKNLSCPERQEAVQEALRLLFEENAREAYKYVSSLRADIRTFVRPVITFQTGSNTPVATAEIVSRLVETVVDGKQILAAAQVSLKGEFLNIYGVTGAPVILSNQGARVVPVELWPEEARAVHKAVSKFKEYLEKIEA